MAFIGNWVIDKASGVLKTGLEAGGNLAGNAVGGVGTLIESSGRGLGNSANGAIGGVGGYVNSYGEGIKNSMAPSGPSTSVEKKTAVKPASAVKGTSSSAQKALPAAVSAKPKAPAPKPMANVSKPATPGARPSAATPPNARSADGKVKIAASSRPKPAGVSKAPSKPLPAGMPSKTPASNMPRKTPTSSAQKIGDGKVKVSPASRPRPMKA